MDRRIPVTAALVGLMFAGRFATAAADPARPSFTVVVTPVAWWNHLPCKIPGPIEMACTAGRAATDVVNGVDKTAKAAGSVAKGASDAGGAALNGADKLGQGLSDASGVVNRGLDQYDHAKQAAKDALARARAEQRPPISVPPGSHLVLRQPDGAYVVLGG